MAEFQGLSTIKNVIMAPLGRVRPLLSPTSCVSARATSFITRHDHHNIEIKTVSELGDSPSVVETDIYVFVPRSFELEAIGKQDLARDFRSRVRLALPSGAEQSNRAFESAFEGFQASLERMTLIVAQDPLFEADHPICEEALESTKDLSAIVSGILKIGSIEHVREFFMSHSLLTIPDACTEGLKRFGRRAQAMHEMIARIRALEHDPSFDATTDAVLDFDPRKPSSILRMLDEYVSQLYVQYLVRLRAELDKIGCPAHPEIDKSAYAIERAKLEAKLDRLQSLEARHRAQFGIAAPHDETEIDRERRLIRLSHLKKFFQSKTFLEVSRHQSARKISESTATIGTAFAAIVAALIERYSRPEVTDVAINGLVVVAMGVIFYVLRDRLKDRVKAIFHRKVLQMLPDFEHHLVVGERRLGAVKEWFRILSPRELPEEILKLRRMVSASEMERRLPEDVFHCRKVHEVAGNPTPTGFESSVSHVRAFHENIRVNFERHLKYMDDPFKDFTDLDLSGRFQRSRTHRVYHFYVCVRTTTRPQDPVWTSPRRTRSLQDGARREQTLVSRVVLDKNGVVRLEELI